MAEIKSYKELKVWQKAHELTLSVYKITSKFPPEEKYGLASQMRRAAVSVSANIVEGFQKLGARDSLNFYNIADASLEELRYEMLLSFELGYIDGEEFRTASEKAEEVSKMLNGWIKSQLKNTKRFNA